MFQPDEVTQIANLVKKYDVFQQFHRPAPLEQWCQGNARLLAGLQLFLQVRAENGPRTLADLDLPATTTAIHDLDELPGPLEFRVGAQPVPNHFLVRHLGRGGSSDVWEAEGPGSVRLALKFTQLRQHFGPLAELRSLRLLRNLRHPNLLSVMGAWLTTDGFLITALELCDTTLQKYRGECLANGLPGIPQGQLLEWLTEAAKALDFLNFQKGIAHRDVKADNLLLAGGGLKVGDFSLAVAMPGAVAPHSGLGMTVTHAAPETFLQREVTRFSDQYALAVTYCELRTGKLPYPMISPFDLQAAHQNGLPPNLHALPAEERPILERALSRDPGQRYPNSRAFAWALVQASGIVARKAGERGS